MPGELPSIADLTAALGPDGFARAIRLAIWVVEGERDNGLELAYYDDELLVFRQPRPAPRRRRAEG